MLNSTSDAKPGRRSIGWSNRILLAAIAGILFLTLHPFQFSLHAHAPLNSSPFFLGSGTKRYGTFASSLNVILFMPFGFGFCYKLYERNWSLIRCIVFTALTGAVFSYLIELVQIYTPMRDSGWNDVFTNTAGSVLGAFVFAGIGKFILRHLSEEEENLESWLSAGRTWLFMVVYLAVCFVISVPLQRETSLKNWEMNSYLFVGNDGSLKSPWEGRVLRFQVWDRAIPDHVAQEITSREGSNSFHPSPLADYNFSLPAPVQDQQRFLPDLSRVPVVPAAKDTRYLAPDGNSWLMTQDAVKGLVSALHEANQFTVRVICEPPKAARADGAIISIAQPAGKENLTLRQEGANFVFWFRSPITTTPWDLRWSLSGVFPTAGVRDILVSYDGSNLSFFVDGRKDSRSSKLGPGVGLAQLLRRARPGEVQLYDDVFYLMVFLPVGCLLGMIARELGMRTLLGPFLVGLFIAPITLHVLLQRVSGGLFAFRGVALSSLVVAGAALWINTDRFSRRNDNLRPNGREHLSVKVN